MNTDKPANLSSDTDIARLRDHYGPDTLKAIYARYIDPDVKNAQVIAEFNIPLTTSNLTRLFPPIERGDKPCRYCNAPTLQRVRSKSMKADHPFDCPLCGHREYDESTVPPTSYFAKPGQFCNCPNCKAAHQLAAQLAAEQKAQKVREWAVSKAQRTAPFPYAGLTFRQKVILLARMATAETGESIPALKECGMANWPMPTRAASDALDEEMLKERILCFAPDSDPDAFTDDMSGYFKGAVRWMPNVAGEEGALLSDANLTARLADDLKGGPRAEWREPAMQLLTEVNIDEGVRVIEQFAHRARLEFNSHEKAREALGRLARDHSLSEIRFYAQRAVISADTYWRGRAKNPGSTIPKGLITTAEIARRDFWTIENWVRDDTTPRSLVAHVLLGAILGGEADALEMTEPLWKIEGLFGPLAAAPEPAGKEHQEGPRCPHCGAETVAVRFETLKVTMACLASGCGKDSVYHLLAYPG